MDPLSVAASIIAVKSSSHRCSNICLLQLHLLQIYCDCKLLHATRFFVDKVTYIGWIDYEGYG